MTDASFQIHGMGSPKGPLWAVCLLLAESDNGFGAHTQTLFARNRGFVVGSLPHLAVANRDM